MHSSLTTKLKLPCSHNSKCSLPGISRERLNHMIASSHMTVQYVCSTVSSMLSGLENRSLGLNKLGTTQSPASSRSVQVSGTSTASWI